MSSNTSTTNTTTTTTTATTTTTISAAVTPNTTLGSTGNVIQVLSTEYKMILSELNPKKFTQIKDVFNSLFTFFFSPYNTHRHFYHSNDFFFSQLKSLS